MNRFRNNFHLAFLDPETPTGPEFIPQSPENSKKDILNLQGEVITGGDVLDQSDFSKIEQAITLNDGIDQEYQTKLERFKNRCDSKPDKSQDSYKSIWEKEIAKGFGHLITVLKENLYFGEKQGQDLANEIAKIKEQYLKEVTDQYKDNVWSAKDDKFNSVKDTLFSRDSEDYPANKIYRKLTGASTIFNNKQNREGYDVDIVDWAETDSNDKDMSERKNRNFLSDDLPEYLWSIRKTPGIINVMKWLPVFTAKVDRPSKEDRRAINDFLKVGNRIPVEEGKDPVMVLLEALHDNGINSSSTKEKYMAVLEKHGMKMDGFDADPKKNEKKRNKCIDAIMQVGRFYLNTQSAENDVKDQHAIYLSVLKVVETEGGMKQAANKYRALVETSEKDKKAEKKGGYESGELLDNDTREFAQKLGITDFTRVSRLLEKDMSYFNDNPVEKILANLNNDRTIDAGDTISGGSKTGAQFLEVFKQVGKEKALSNLLERAKLLNKTLGLGLNEAITFGADAGKPRFTEERIKQGDFNLILLLQDIINKPGEDLYELLSGNVETIDSKALEAAKKVASEKLAEMKIDRYALERDGVRLPTPESMQSGLAASLYAEYERGIGLGGKISFDQWIKGVEMNTGFQVRDDGTVVVGIGLDYHKRINLGKGWSTTPELSAGGFIPLGYGKPELTGSVAINDEIAKERLTKENGVLAHFGIQGGVTLMPAGVVVVSAGLNWERSKLDGLEEKEQMKKIEFNTMMCDILDNAQKSLSEKGKTKLDFSNDPEVANILKQSILAKAKTEKIPEDKQENVVNATMRALLKYNNYDLSDETTRKIIAQGVAEQYAMAWAEDRKAHITDKAYLSGANLGAFWIAGSPLVGIYAGIKFTKHDLDGYGDKAGREYAVDHSETGIQWTQEMLDNLNQRLHLQESNGLKIENGFIAIPSSIAYKVSVNEKMKGLMKKENGKIILDRFTPMQERVWQGAATQGAELVIGGSDGAEFKKLDQLGDERFTTGDINSNDVMLLGEGVRTYTAESLNQKLKELKGQFPGMESIQNFTFNMDEILTQLNALDRSKKGKIIIAEEGGILKPKVEAGADGRGLEIEYQAKFEMIDQRARNIANEVYAEALKLNNPKALNDVKHKPWPQYAPFNEAMQAALKDGNYKTAKEKIKPIFEELDKQIKGAQFKRIGEMLNVLDDTKDNIVIGQALMSINNIFARSKKVVGGGEKYHFRDFISNKPMSMGRVIAEREGQIAGTIRQHNEIPTQVKEGYLSLISASAKYRKENPNLFKVTEAPAAQLNNTVGFNLGDKTNPENPLFNPEIYNPMVDLKNLEGLGFTKKDKDALHQRAMELFAGNKALRAPILKALGFNENATVTIPNEHFSIDGEKGKFKLDIGGKIVTLSAGMKFGYFTQCVNHTVILDDFSAETQDGVTMTFDSGLWENGRYIEGNKSSIVSTTEVGASVAVVASEKGGERSHSRPGEREAGDVPGTQLPGQETTNPNADNGNNGGGTQVFFDD